MTKPIGRDTIYRCRRFSAETIELCVRWYITYRLSYRDLAAMMAEREVIVSHTTIMRWVLHYAPEYERSNRELRRGGMTMMMGERTGVPEAFSRRVSGSCAVGTIIVILMHLCKCSVKHQNIGESILWDPLESTCRHASLSIL